VRRKTGLIVLVACVAGLVWWGWPLARGYLEPSRLSVPNAPIILPSQPSGNGVSPAKGGSAGNHGSPSQSGRPQVNTGTSIVGKADHAGNQTDGESVIDLAYRAKLRQIGDYYQGQLDALVAQAYNSYKEVRAGTLHESLIALAGQYIREGQTLEGQSDNQFYSVLKQYRAALEKEGLPLTYEEQAQNAYESAKAAERQKIFSAAMQYLK